MYVWIIYYRTLDEIVEICESKEVAENRVHQRGCGINLDFFIKQFPVTMKGEPADFISP